MTLRISRSSWSSLFAKGYWGCVAYGASLTGEGVEGEDAQLAETLAGPIQTLFRIEAGPEAYMELLGGHPSIDAGNDLAVRVHERVRQLRGHWKAMRFGGDMALFWPEWSEAAADMNRRLKSR